MQVFNLTPFPFLRFFNTDNEGREFGVALVKGTYVIDGDGTLSVADEQAPLVFTDTYHGALNTSSLWMPSDLVPKKPRTDVLLNAVARAPTGRPAPTWLCGIRIEGEQTFGKRLRVTGPRHWEPVWGVSERARASMSVAERRRMFQGWRLSQPEAIHEVPIRYELAFGGSLRRPRPGTGDVLVEPDERNPIGCGWIDAELTPIDGAVPAPQIEDADQPIVAPHARPAPAGFGPIPPAWMPRRPLGGTFDAHWKQNVWPRWPADYDFAYHNSSHPDLVYPGFLRGDEKISLHGLHDDGAPHTLTLPGDAVAAGIGYGDAKLATSLLALDTLFLDVADPDPDEHRVFLTWRMTFDATRADTLALILTDRGFEAGEVDLGSIVEDTPDE